MTKTKFTIDKAQPRPGPVFYIATNNMLATAEVRGRDSEKLLKLLSAAPELLEACEMAAAFVGMHTGNGVPSEYAGKFDSFLDSPYEALEVITDAINKAKEG